MNDLIEYLKRLYISCKIPFKFEIDGNMVYETDSHSFESDLLEIRFNIGMQKVKLLTKNKYKDAVKILEFCIRERYTEKNDKEKILMELLSNISVGEDEIKEYMPSLEDDTYLIVISLNDKINDCIEMLRSIYADTHVTLVNDNNIIILLGSFENINEHVISIYDTIHTSAYQECFISYFKVKGYEYIKDYYDDALNKISLAKKYHVYQKVFSENSLIFEKLIDGLTEDTKKQIVRSFNNYLMKLDKDMLKTIEVFLECDLNLSECAKKLYVHRNTLIYRLDKIEKYTSYDIRKFNDACIFKIGFNIWKQEYRK